MIGTKGVFAWAAAAFVALAGCSSSSGGGATAADAGSESGCGQACPIWQVACGDRCVDTTTSPLDCGRCGVKCDPSTEVCQGGVCQKAPRCAPLASPDAGAGDAGSSDASTTSGSGLRGEYYATEQLTSLALVRTDPTVDFDWTTDPPDPSMSHDHYSVRWTARLHPKFAETYTFYAASDDGVRLWIDDQPLIDSWTNRGVTEDTATMKLDPAKTYALRMEYYQVTGAAIARLSWSSASQPKQIIPASQLELPTTPAPAFTCATGECCPNENGGAICCPLGTTCVIDPSFTGCCPEGETCTPVTCTQ